MKKGIYFLLLFSLISFGLCIKSVSAAEIQENQLYLTRNGQFNLSNMKPGYELMGLKKPTEVWNLAKKGTYKLEGYADNNALYSEYLFTGVTSIKVTLTETGKYYPVTAELYRKDWIFDNKIGDLTAAKDSTKSRTFTGLDKSKNYYLRIPAPCQFKGTVSAG